jgi:hypothetical protein
MDEPGFQTVVSLAGNQCFGPGRGDQGIESFRGADPVEILRS